MAIARPVPVENPGILIEEELEARAWTQADLAYILGWDASQLNKLIKGVTKIMPDTAVSLGDAFGMPPEFFMNLQMAYDLQHAKIPDPGVRTRAIWLSKFPIRDMIKRGWLEETDADLLDLQMMRFFDVNRTEDIPLVGQTKPHPTTPCPTSPDPTPPNHAPPRPASPHRTEPCRTTPSPAMPHPAEPRRALPNQTAPNHALPCPARPHQT